MPCRHLLALSLIPALAACGGGGATSLGGGGLPGPAGFDALILETDALATKTDAPGFGPSVTLPTEDGVEYDGIMVVAANFETADEGYLGDFAATVDFTSGDMTGTGSGFFFSSLDSSGDANGPGIPVAGEITALSTNVALGDFDVDMTGTLFVDGQVRTIDSSTGIGAFAGDNGDVLVGEGSIGFDPIETTLGVIFIAD